MTPDQLDEWARNAVKDLVARLARQAAQQLAKARW